MATAQETSFLQRNGLTIVALGLFLAFWIAQAVSGYLNNNLELQAHGQLTKGFFDYLSSAEFWEATFENWESEFLQMGLFVILTAKLYQKGSGESRSPDAVRRATHGAALAGGGGGGGAATQEKPQQQQPKAPDQQEVEVERRRQQQKLDRMAPQVRFLYEHSLSTALLGLFAVSWVGHVVASWWEHNDQQVMHGDPAVSLLTFLAHPQLWFESFQNWQSEFLAITAMVVLSIFLREKNSTESKDVEAPDIESGEEE